MKPSKKILNIILLVLLALLLVDALVFNGRFHQLILWALIFDIVLGFCLNFINSFWAALALSLLVVVGLAAVAVLATMADARKGSLDWQIGAAIGMGFFNSALCLLCFALSFPLFKHFQNEKELVRRLKLAGWLCVVMPLLEIPLMILLVVQQFHHQSPEVLPTVIALISLVSILGSLFPWGYLATDKGKLLKKKVM